MHINLVLEAEAGKDTPKLADKMCVGQYFAEYLISDCRYLSMLIYPDHGTLNEVNKPNNIGQPY